MRVSPFVLAAVLVSQSQALPTNLQERAVQYVTATTTSRIGLANFLAALVADPTSTTAATVAAVATTTTPAAAAAATTAAATTTKKSGFWSGLLDSLFGDDDDETSSTAAVVAATTTSTAATATAATTTAAASSTKKGFDFFSLFYGDDSSTTASASVGGTASATASTLTSTSTLDNTVGNSQIEAYAAKGKGITYSPYTKSGQCKTADEVADDMAKLTSYDIIRLYAVDCSGIENVLASITSSQKVFLGIYSISDPGAELSSIQEAVEGSSRGWSAVHTVSIGNEMVNSGTNTAQEIVTAIEQARTWFDDNAPSYSGYIVTVDTAVAVKANTILCDASDYLAVNIHPYWDGGVDPSDSGPWLEEQVSLLKSACGNSKSVLITETGWPTAGDTYGNCVPSVANQLKALKSIATTLPNQVIMFTLYNDYWKDGGPYNVEKYWGLYGDPEV